MTGEGHYPSLLLALGGPKVCLPEAAGPDVNTASQLWPALAIGVQDHAERHFVTFSTTIICNVINCCLYKCKNYYFCFYV